MSMTDPIADLLARIRNAHTARHRTLELPASRIKEAIVAILCDEGYVEGYERIDGGPQGKIRIALKYVSGGVPAIRGMERISRPGRRIYRSKGDVPSVLGGLGITILSTPKGVMTGTASRRAGVGGEVLCSVW
jgi:small subunit ribosomal protein S8